jgi:hypothetical protein
MGKPAGGKQKRTPKIKDKKQYERFKEAAGPFTLGWVYARSRGIIYLAYRRIQRYQGIP